MAPQTLGTTGQPTMTGACDRCCHRYVLLLHIVDAVVIVNNPVVKVVLS